jgi:hypothetical protein
MTLDQIPKYQYSKNDLLDILVTVGFSSSTKGAYQKLHRFIKRGLFTPPVVPWGTGNTPNVKKRGWAFTKDHLIQISKELGPGGHGEWHFRDN